MRIILEKDNELTVDLRGFEEATATLRSINYPIEDIFMELLMKGMKGPFFSVLLSVLEETEEEEFFLSEDVYEAIDRSA